MFTVDKKPPRASASVIIIPKKMNRTITSEMAQIEKKPKHKIPKSNNTNSYFKKHIKTEPIHEKYNITDKSLSDNIYILQHQGDEITRKIIKNKKDYLGQIANITKHIHNENNKQRPKSCKENNELIQQNPTMLYYEAYKKIYNNFSTLKKNKEKKIKENYDLYYRHSGVYREFIETNPINNVSNSYWAWSCCLKEDKEAKGCIKQYEKKMKWSFD